MRRTLLVAMLAVGACVVLAPACAAGPLDLLLIPGLPSPTDVVKLIDALTRKDSSTTADVKVGKVVGQGKLLVAQSRVDVVLDRSTRNWRGQVRVELTVPSDASYSLDLSAIKPEDIRCDPKEGVLTVTMPALAVEAVSPRLSEVEVKDSFRRGRFKFFDARDSRDLQNVMLREDYVAKARDAARAGLPQARAEGKEVLQQFLQRLLQGAFPEVRVVVE